MPPTALLIGAISILALISIGGAYFFGVSPWVTAIIILGALAAQWALESAEQYFPGGERNPYTAKTVGKRNVRKKVLIFLGALAIAGLIWAATIAVIRYVS